MMYEISGDWLPYFEELDPKTRLKFFNEKAGRGGPLQDFCRTLYRERYTDPKHPDRPVDTWLWKFVYLPGLYRRRKLMRRALKKEMASTAADLHLSGPAALGELERAVLYLEFRNAARRYLSTCGGARYASKMLGLQHATQEEKRLRACEDLWMASRGLAREAGMEETFALWADALRAELAEYDPDSWKHYEELERNSQK